MIPKYRSDIDGLRAVAVMSVLFFHLGIQSFSGGYVGVDIFFVISGYLITTIIAGEIKNNSFSIVKFYERRFRRILPALTVVIVFTFIVSAILFDPKSFIDFGKSAIATSLFSSNILFYFHSGYFDGPAELKPLLHTWSLAVEEQYYILFPIILIVIAKLDPRQHYGKYLVIICLSSFIACILVTKVNPSAAFYLIPTRAWELLIGSILAIQIVSAPKKPYFCEALSIIGFSLISISIFCYTPKTSFPGFAAAMPSIGTALIIYSGISRKTLIHRILSIKPIVFVGLISYSLYLWHWPIIVYAKYYLITELSSLQITTLLTLISIISILSWRYIEKPFREKKLLTKQANILVVSVLVSIAITLCGLILVIKDGFPNRYSNIQLNDASNNDLEWEKWGHCEDTEKKSEHKDLCSIGDEKGKLNFILWGDSHARALASAVDLSAKNYEIRGKIAAQPSCPPLDSIERPNLNTCHKYNQAILDYINKTPEIKTVILVARWTIFANGTRYKHETNEPVDMVDISLSKGDNSSNQALLEIGLIRTIEKLHNLGKKVVLVRPVPEIGYDVPSAYFVSKITGREVNQIVSPTYSEYLGRTILVDTIFLKLKKQYPIQIIDPSTYLCDKDYCRVVVNDKPLYRDDDHLSTFGSRYVSDSFNTIFEKNSR